MDIVTWLVFGLIVGVVANAIDPRPAQGGMVGAIVLGIVGAMVGGFLGNMVFGVNVTGFNIQSFLVAIAGSLLVMMVGRMLIRSTRDV